MNTSSVRFGMWSPRDQQQFDKTDQRIAQTKELANKSTDYLVDQLDKLASPDPDTIDKFVKDLAPGDDERRLTLETELLFSIGGSKNDTELESTKAKIGKAPHYQPSPFVGQLVSIVKSILAMPAKHQLPASPTDVDKQKIAVTSEMAMGLADEFKQKQMMKQFGGRGGPNSLEALLGGLGGGPGSPKVIFMGPKGAKQLPPQEGQGGQGDLDGFPPQGGQGGDDDIMDLLNDTDPKKK